MHTCSNTVPDPYADTNLTNNQLQVWLAQNLLPEAPIFNLAVALHLDGEIDPDHFRRAFRVLVDSSDALRTVVEEHDGIPVQRVLPEAPAMTDFLDFSHSAEAEARASTWMAARCVTPMNQLGALYDSALIKVGPERFVWYFNVHHMICDGWSFELIYRHMADLYRASLNGRLPARIGLPVFADYLAHEREFRRSTRYQKAQAYWSEALAHGGQGISFYGKPPLWATTRVRRVSQDLGEDRTEELKRIAATIAGGGPESATLFNVFAAALVGYLYCLNGGDSYTIGVPFHNRRSQFAFKRTIGFFSEVLPVRVTLDEDETLASLSKKFGTQVRTGMRYGQRSVSNPVFRRLYEVTLNYHTRSFAEFAGMPARPEWIHNGHGDESLGIQVRDFGSSRNLAVDFDLHEGIFDQADSARVPMHFLRLLDAFLLDPGKPIRRLSLASPEETKRVIAEWNTGVSVSAGQHCVHHLFEEQARKRPDATAVVQADSQLTYGELNRRANALARRLRQRGIEPQSRIGIYLSRSPEMILAILGVLKAGAAYVPVDPQYSSEWLKFILEDSGASALLTQRNLLQSLPERDAETICLDDPAAFNDSDCDDPGVAVAGDDLAYIIYTSGSTGKPKGVEVTHRALANFTAEAAKLYALTPTDRVLQFASLSFDTSVEEIFPCLAHGSVLVLRTESTVDSTPAVLEQINRWGITVLDFPTAYWHELTTTLYGERQVLPSSVRIVIIGGERAIPEKVALWQMAVGSGVTLLNTYGPTESTVVSTVYDLTHAMVECGADAEIPIGRPIANTQTLVLDQNLYPVPEGVPGELYIGGIGLARGYLGRPDLTAENFVPNPFDGGSGARLYKTGDIVRYRGDGNLEFLRRSDEQVKIRGFRVDLRGVASVLREHPLVRDAVVLEDRESRPTRLVAYVVPEASAVLSLTEVQDFVKARLPDYMVPAALVRLESLPLTERGKLDRRALALVSIEESERQENLVPPQSVTEQRIADIWRELLSLTMIGRNQHFFEIGGHSLLAAQVISRIRREWQVDLPLRAIFEAPTIALLAECVEQALRRGYAADDATPIALGSYDRQAPASNSQSRIWYMDQFAPESSAYNIAAAIRFTGFLDRQALQQSVDCLMERHESLRTTVRSVNGEPIQVIDSSKRLDLAEIDLTTCPDEALMDEARRIVTEEAKRPFDLSSGPLLRLLLLRLHDNDHVLLLTMHHVIADHWSLNVMAREISSLYNDFRNGASPALEPPAAQYGDFALWQNRQLSPDRLQDGLRYWRDQLAGVEASAFPTDRPRPPTQTFRGAHRAASVPTPLLENLRRLAVEEGATLYMVFLAIFKILVSRYTGRDDVAIGSPVTNRTRSEWEGIIGTFINILVLRTDLSGNPSLRHIIRRIRETVLEAFTHQEVPFEKLVEELAPGRDSRRSPLVQVLFNFLSTPVGKVSFDGISWAPFEIDQWAAQFDISVTVDPEITRKIYVSYNTDLYDQSTIGRLLDSYIKLLEAAARDADQLLGAAVLSIFEAQGPRAAVGDSELSIPERCVHELFEDQAVCTPDAIAVEFEDQQLSYKELNDRADQLARRLRASGIGPEKLVGIVLERSPELIIAILGILKAGTAYVPIDPAYPSERVAFICDDSSMAALVTQKALLAALPKRPIPILCLDETEHTTGRQTMENFRVPVCPEQLAYVIYTSGSTGRPKGVQISHRALVNFLSSMQRQPGLVASDIFMSVTTVSFDIAALELFLPLISGARVMIASRETAADGKRLRETLDVCRATVMQATPTTWRMMIDAGWTPDSDMKIICGGEALPVNLAQALSSRSNAVWNLYGPTETTVWSSIWPVQRNAERISIGCPIHNTQIHVLDSTGLPVPVGVVGELYIGGEGLARGYLNRPELTAEKFVPNPFGKPSSRLYRTGDLGRYLEDGNIEFIGRIDNQVKVRGYRIELGEVEAVLAGHEEVREAAVVVRGEETDKRLVAYVVRQADKSVTERDLASHAKRKLPSYMVPSAIVFLDRLPLTPNGKIDRRALPAVETDEQPSREFLGSHTAVQEMIEGVWQHVLKRSKVTIHDNFFDLGGHSLLATQVIARLREAFRLDLPLRAIFEAPTIAELANLVESNLGRSTAALRPPLNQATEREENSVSFAQERLWFLNQLQPDHCAYNISLAARVTGELDIASLEQSLSQIIKRHDILRASFVAIEGRLEQRIAAAGPVSIPVVDLRDMPESERENEARRLAVELIQLPFDLARGPLFRLALLRIDDGNHVLVFVVHHIIFDGQSTEVFLDGLIEDYEKAFKGEESQLPRPTFQYADYAAWQRRMLQGEFIERQIAYWKRQLDGPPSLLKLPTDRPRPSVKSYRGATYSWKIPAAMVNGLRSLSRGEDVTLFMTLLAAFDVLLHRYAAQNDIIIGIPISGRTTVETESMMGLFINTLAIRADLSGDPSFRALLHRVRETALGAYTHQDLPFEQLLNHLGLERSLAFTPLFQVMFSFQTQAARSPEFPGLTVQPVEVESRTAKFDLTLSMTAIGDEIHAVFEYDTDLFERGTIARMTGCFRRLLQAIVADPGQRLSALRLVDDAERDQLLQWSSGPTEPATEACLHLLFEAQVERTPDAIAMVCGDETWSYRELNEKANQLARGLSERGVGPRVMVGICMERVPALMVALLATLKAGGTYVPLDPELPTERLEFMLRDAGCAALITQSRLLAKIPPIETEIICLDSVTEFAREPGDNLDVAVTPDDSVYVMYTSGSTGSPKGIVLPHRALTNYLKWAVKAYAVEHGKGTLAFSSIGFDLTVTSLFAPLLVGKAIELVRDALDGETLAKALCRGRNLSFVKLTPSHLDLLTRQIPKEDGGGLARYIILGGEILTADQVRFWREAAPGTTIVNEYGPTEAAVGCCVYTIDNGAQEAGSIPIGRPIDNVQAYILDAAMEPVPVGVAGELYIGGEGLAWGYLNRPELTAEKFVPNPFGKPSSRLYRTGDLGRYLEDGNIEFIGRIDNQVKVRGYRIELGEIEAVLAQHPEVREAVVQAWEESENLKSKIENLKSHKRLVAYVVRQADKAVTERDLASYAKRKLPSYMVPSAIVFLDRLPLTPNGKIDRRALPVPEIVSAKNQDTAPADRLEFELTHLWRKYLGTGNFGLRDSFFDLGGDSLRAARLLAEVEKQFGKRIRLIDFFVAPTVADLAALLRESGCPSNWTSLVPIQPRGSKPPFFWVHGDGSNFLLPDYLGEDQPLYGFMHQCQDGMPARYTSVEAIASHYLEEMCSVQREGPYFLGGYSFGGVVAFEMAQQLVSRGEEVALLALVEATRPLKRTPAFDKQPSGPDARRESGNAYGTLRSQRSRIEAQRILHVAASVIALLKRVGRFANLKRAYKRLLYRLVQKVGRRIPQWVCHTYLMDVYSEAVRRYEPGTFCAPVIFFQAERDGRGRMSGWENLIGEAEVRRVPGNHASIIEKPHLAIWAEEIRDLLKEAQSAPRENLPARGPVAPLSLLTASSVFCDGNEGRAAERTGGR